MFLRASLIFFVVFRLVHVEGENMHNAAKEWEHFPRVVGLFTPYALRKGFLGLQDPAFDHLTK